MLKPCPFCDAEPLSEYAWTCTTFRAHGRGGPDYNRGSLCFERVAMAAVKAREAMAEELRLAQKEVADLKAVGDARTVSAVRPEVSAFAAVMEYKLRENDHKGGWANETIGYLFRRLREEVEELDLAARNDACNTVHEAADVANFAMMVACEYGLMEGRSDVL